MPEIKVFLPNHSYEPHPAQALIHQSDKRFRVAIMGRKFGKTEMAQREMMNYMGVPESVGWWAAPQYKVSDIAWERLNNSLNPKLIKSRSSRDHKIKFINDSVINFVSTENTKGLVGEGIDFLVMEEFSYINEGIWLEKIRPNLGDAKRIGEALMISTPNGLGWGYKEWVKGQKEEFLDYESWRYDFDVMPIIKEKIERLPGGFPSWVNPYWKDLKSIIGHPRNTFLQEYGARFLESLGNVFLGLHKIEYTDKTFENKPVPEKEYYVGFDVARSGTGDNAVISVIDADYTVQHLTVMKGKGLPYQVDVAKDICEEWNDAEILVDTTNPMGDSVYEFLEKAYNADKVNGFHYTTAKKRDLIDNLSLLVQTGQIIIPNRYGEANELIEEMRVFTATNTGITIKYHAPEGFHDDYVNSLALACWLLKEDYNRWEPAFEIF